MNPSLHAMAIDEPRVLEGISAKTQKPYKMTLQRLSFFDSAVPENDTLSILKAPTAVCVVASENGYPIGKAFPVLSKSFRVKNGAGDPRLELGSVHLDTLDTKA